MSTEYDKARQESFDFLKDVSKSSPVSKEKTPEYQEIESRSVWLLQKIIDRESGCKNIVKALKDYGFSFKKQKDTLLVQVGNKRFLVNKQDHPILVQIS